MSVKTKEYYLNLDYEIVVRKLSVADGGGYFVYYKDLPGIMGDGESAEAAIRDARDAFGCYLDVALEGTEEIKEPSHLSKSKRINITIPVSVLNEIDRYVASHQLTRSAFFKESALQAIR